jgi:hypothetical protein
LGNRQAEISRAEKYWQAGLQLGFNSFPGADYLADDKLYKSEYIGSGTFIISKPKRKKAKQRQSNLKNVKRGSRK